MARGYRKYTLHAEIEKSVNSLLGILEGITADTRINQREHGYLQTWLGDHAEYQGHHPYKEMVPRVEAAVRDGILTAEEHADLKWLCERLMSQQFFDQATASMQRLHGILGGISADGTVAAEELRTLRIWLDDHDELRQLWPFDEVDSLVTSCLSDGRIDPEEHSILLAFFSQFSTVLDSRTITDPVASDGVTLSGVCAVAPEVVFEESVFVFTGESRLPRSELVRLVGDRGGRVAEAVSRKVRYLVIGASGNPAWAYACYGRKVEQAMALRREGHRLLLVHENDFHDAVLG